MTRDEWMNTEVKFHAPPPPKWELEIAPLFCFRPSGDQRVPNAFHRFMQRLCFGFKWRRLP